MILLLDTSTPVCRLTLVENSKSSHYEWQADRTLANGLLAYIEQTLAKLGADFSTITGIGVMKGPGSFTGLRIGITVLNTIADTNNVPIVGETGEDWQDKATSRLQAGESEHVVLPDYGRDANITKPRK